MLSFSPRSIAVAAMLLAVSTAGNAATINATSADDVCASAANPCVITDVVKVSPGAALDFGPRALSITGHGRLDFGSGSAKILCGPLTVSTNSEAIRAVGPANGGGIAGGAVEIIARSACSEGASTRACRNELDCQLGTCSARRCSGRTSAQCTADADCSGTCTNRRCSNSVSTLRCATNADCNFGTCPEQLSCSATTEVVQHCSADSDCAFGTCSVGEGSIIFEGSIEGRSGSPAEITLEASGSIALSGSIDVSSTSTEGDGGYITVNARGGDVVLEGSMRARGGALGAGGFLDISAGRDATVTGLVNLTGGDSDGGQVSIGAGRDVTFDSDIHLSAISGSGWAGGMDIFAERNIMVGSGPTRRRITANGHSDGESYGGGGNFDLYAEGEVVIAQGVDIRARGARNGVAGYFDVDAGGSFRMDGRIRERTGGKEGQGGLFSVHATKDITFGDSAIVNLRSVYGGSLDLYSENGNALLGGSVQTGGPSDGGSGGFALQACRVTLAGSVTSHDEGGYSSIVAHESMRLLPGSSMLTPRGGNTLAYRAAEKPPVLEGTVKPAPLLELLTYLNGCPVCANSEIDEGETCDDGNTAAGDGCDDLCQVE